VVPSLLVRSFVAFGLWCGLRPVGAAAAAFAYAQFFLVFGALPSVAVGLWKFKLSYGRSKVA